MCMHERINKIVYNFMCMHEDMNEKPMKPL